MSHKVIRVVWITFLSNILLPKKLRSVSRAGQPKHTPYVDTLYTSMEQFLPEVPQQDQDLYKHSKL